MTPFSSRRRYSGDGIEADFIEFNSGTSVTIGIAPKKGLLVA